MIKTVIIGLALAVPGLALACGGADSSNMAYTMPDVTPAVAAHPTPMHHQRVDVAVARHDPAACAHKASLVGANCSYTTGMMAQRVLAEGAPWSYTGGIDRSANALGTHVAAPFTVGPNHKVNLIANEVLEALTDQGLDAARVSLQGKRLDVDGVTYFVLTSFSVPNS